MVEKIPILKGKKLKTRILRPYEFELLREGAKKTDYKTLLDACLLLGARYKECQKIQNNPHWFDGNFVHLPSDAQEKVKRKQVERWIRLSSMGKVIMPYFLENKKRLPSIQAWDHSLIEWGKREGVDTVGISARSLRKTYESWLIFYYPEATNLIYLSQGHTTLTSLQHYVNLPFLEEDKRDMKKWVEGWL